MAKDVIQFRTKKGQTLEDLERRIGTYDGLMNKLRTRQNTKYKKGILELGSTEDNILLFTQEMRKMHIHIMGAPQMGKSSLLLKMIYHDIDRLVKDYENAAGFVVEDPSDNADTIKKTVAYCAYKGYKKVLVIDPQYRFKYYGLPCIPKLNPYEYQKNRYDESVNVVGNTIKSVYNSWDEEKYTYVNKYLFALNSLLINTGLTLNELIYYSVFNDDYYKFRRKQIRDTFLSQDTGNRYNRNHIILEDTLISNYFFGDLGSTLRRFDTLFKSASTNSTLNLMVASKDGIDFTKLIKEKWVILVNLNTDTTFDTLQARFLGSLILNKLLATVSYMREYTSWNGVEYLYIDEAGQYANRLLGEVMELKSKSGIGVCVAHHHYQQLEDLKFRADVDALTKIKIMFNLTNRDDRDRMTKQMYGGDISIAEASHANSNLPPRTAIIKAGNEPPVRVRLGDLPPVPITQEQVENFIKEHILTNGFYATEQEILNELKERFKPYDSSKDKENNKRANRKASASAKASTTTPPSDDQPDSPTDVPKDAQREKRSSLFESFRNSKGSTGKNKKTGSD